MTKNDFFNYSGGAPGADMFWDSAGRFYGFNNHQHFTPEHFKKAPLALQRTIEIAVEQAADALKRPKRFNGMDLVKRNWFQQHNAQAIFAISRIILPGDYSDNHENKTGRQIVSGGTGWTVEMARQNAKPIFVFDMLVKAWCEWDYKANIFRHCEIPALTLNYAGIGSRRLTLPGREAIHNVYKQTIKHIENEKSQQLL